MLRFTSRRLLLDKLGNTKLGAEVLAQTRNDMRHIEDKDNFIVRFLARRRPIDYLAIEVDGPITKELSPAFVYAKHTFTAVLCLPVFFLFLSGTLAPTYYLLVPTRIMTTDKYTRMWEFSNRGMELLGQAVCCLIFYDFSAYMRYPFFAKVLAPFFRSQGWLRPQSKARFTVEQLRRGAAMREVGSKGSKPLGRPLGDVRRAMRTDLKPQLNPFGKQPAQGVAAARRSTASAAGAAADKATPKRH